MLWQIVFCLEIIITLVVDIIVTFKKSQKRWRGTIYILQLHGFGSGASVTLEKAGEGIFGHYHS